MSTLRYAEASDKAGSLGLISTGQRPVKGAGWDVANGASYSTTVSTLVDSIWASEAGNDKSKMVWPNPNAPDNYTGSSMYRFDYNLWYSAPGFLFMTE